MYGLVNRSVEELIVAEHGDETWERVKARAGCDEAFFMSHESYPDKLTYDLVAAACEELSAQPEQILEAFGRYWISGVATKHYGTMITTGGPNLCSFLLYLPTLHRRVHMIFPKLQPPVFVTHETAEGLELEYHSERNGLVPFVRGLLLGLAEHFEEQVTVEHLGRQGGDSGHERFSIRWLQ